MTDTPPKGNGSSDGCPDAAVLAAFMARALEESRRLSVEAHCEACETCRATLSHAVLAFAPSVTRVATAIDEARSDAVAVIPRGTALGRYIVLDELGRGAMGIVYRAYDPELDRKVALKVLHASLRDDPRQRASWRARLIREARALAAMTHPNVITIFDVGTWDDDVFIAMELVEGTTLSKWLHERPRSPRDIVQVFLAAGRGLAAAHAHGLVHRDFKPDNVLVASDGSVRVSDFGLARFVAGETKRESIEDDGDPQPAPDTPIGETRSGAMVGTPAYMSPEQLQGRAADARSDQYGYCVALHEALHGERPFRAVTAQALLQAQREPPSGFDSKVHVPARIRRALVRGLSFEPEHRFESMQALLAALEPPRVRRWGAWGLLALGLVGGGVGVRLVPTSDVCATPNVEALWNDALSHEVTVSLQRSDAVLALDRAARISRRLAARVTEYDDAAQRACRAGDAAATVCLEAWRLDFVALTQRLTSDDPAVLDIADGLVLDVSDPAACSDRRTMPALPSDPAEESRAKALWLALAEARRALVADDDDAGALARLEAERAAIETLAHPPLLAEFATLECSVLQLRREFERAQERCSEAARTALAAGHRGAFENAALALSSVFTDLEQYERGLQWLDLAEATRIELGLKPRTPDTASRRAWLYGLFGRYEDAVSLVEQEAQRLEEADETGELVLRGNLVAWFHALGRHEEATRTARWAVQRSVELYGERSIMTTKFRTTLATSLLEQGDPEAIDQLEQIVDALTAARGAGDPLLLVPYRNLAVALMMHGHSERALRANARALALADEAAPDAGLQRAQIEIVSGHCLADLGREAEAEATLKAAVERLEAAVDVRPVRVPWSLVEVALFHLTRGHHEQARALLRRAKALATQHELASVHPIVDALLRDANRRRDGASLASLLDPEAPDRGVEHLLAARARLLRTAPKRRG